MSSAAAQALKFVSRAALSWKPTRRPQQTLAATVSRSGVGLHSGARVTATLIPAHAGEGRYFLVDGEEEARLAAEVGNAEPRSQLCTTLRRTEGGGPRVRTVEHLLSAMEALGVDNCRVERDDCFIAAFPSLQIRISYGIDFPKVPAIECQWFSTYLDPNIYSSKIAPARTFCIFEEIEKIRGAGLIKGGSLENAMVCSMSGGWLNPPVRFEDEPCRHKILDLIGDFSLLAQNGNQGFPIAHIVAYKAGHALHTHFLSYLSGKITVDQEELAGQC
ncbi:probable UDP-3-O-acyl-N-acetylglucosamine deacetylase 1, mitochondrial isoform X4 [Panicum virgatum]|uniref:probable UDP-3-O-acyl-N-acetylglucosamine deacetylase 1, mitochondrial isoform X4 n=1 Tax=Panicum virgatum TaxID=38727 RepID=UPI0019D67E01|nr:probable UDP-3-O-acyl-N-acetylglucosamine deacetylase 1, mitochondrial isoform X4 [Panicum virgatum]